MALELKFTIPGQVSEVVPLTQQRMIIGTLLSNHVVLRAPGIDPIHAMIEDDNGSFVLTDLGSSTGVKINGRPIDVETPVKANDRIEIGGVKLEVCLVEDHAPPIPIPGAGKTVPSPVKVASAKEAPTKVAPEPVKAQTATVAASTVAQVERRREEEGDSVAQDDEKKLTIRKDVLFSPRDAKPSGDVLEGVAYWGDTVLEVDLFHPEIKGNESITIGDPTVSHFIAAGPDDFSRHTLASVGGDGYRLRLLDGMEGRIRKGGKVEMVKGKNSFNLGRRDIAHIKYGAVRYFLLFVNPPTLDLPRSGPKDPLFMSLMTIAMFFYFLVIGSLWMTKPIKKADESDDVWATVYVPEKKKPEPEKPKIEIAKVEEKPKPTPKQEPPKPKPPPPKPAPPVEKEKPKQPEPPKDIPKPKPVEALKPQEKPPVVDKFADKVEKKEGPPGPKSKEGMPSTGAKKPDFKLAGPKTSGPLGPAGGPQGSGLNQFGGERKGNKKVSVMGVEGVDNDKPSGVNLEKLGIGVGKVLSKTGAGAIHTDFKNSAGGAGGGSGSGAKTYGLGGVGTGKSLGLAGAGSQVNNFGSGSGGLLSGQGGTGGLGGAGLGTAFGTGKGAGGQGGRGRANVSVPESDPLVSTGLTAQEVLNVIRANLNQIRHCYEQLLQRSPNTSGKTDVEFIIGLNGRVTTARVVSSSISDSIMKACVTGRISRWQFPNPRGGQPVTVTYPFVFNPI